VIVWVIGISELDGFARGGPKLVFWANPESIDSCMYCHANVPFWKNKTEDFWASASAVRK
jgi:hypothetical protein